MVFLSQESCDYLDRGQASSFSRKGPSTIQKIKEALNFMRNQHFEVPPFCFHTDMKELAWLLPWKGVD